MHRSVARLYATAALAALASPLAAADTLPPRQPGLWESKSTSVEGSVTARQCIDEKTDGIAQNALGGGQACAKKTLTRTATGYATEAECKIGAVSATGKGVISGDFTSNLRIETTTILTGLPNQKEPVTRKLVVEATRLGPCEAGQQPGDIILPDGKVVKMPTPPK